MAETTRTPRKSFSLSPEFVARQFRGRRQQRIRHSCLSMARLKRNILTKGVLQSFVENSSFGVLLQIVLAVVSTVICQSQACYQRREKVLDDLANLKASAMVLFFCHRDWWKPAGLSENFLTNSLQNLRDLMGYVQSYLKKAKGADRITSLGRVYHCMSEVALATERLRVSKLAMSGPLATRLIHYNNMMCWAFERLRVVREYRSPRTIQAFSKVLVFLIPIVLSPYYVHIGHDPNDKAGPKWAPYYVAILVSFVLGSLQAVEDALDDPFDGISEDDINLDQLQDWSHFALIVSPPRSLHDSIAASLPDSEVALDEHVAGEGSSLRRRNQADFQGDLEQMRKQAKLAGPSPDVEMNIQQQCAEKIEHPPLMSSPVDLFASIPVELDPLDMDIDSIAWSHGMSEKTIQDLRTPRSAIDSSREERSPTPGSTAALRKKLASRVTVSSTKQQDTIGHEETSISPELLEEDTSKGQMRRSNNTENSPSFSQYEISSPLSTGSFLGSPTFDSNVSQFKPKRQQLSESDTPLHAIPEPSISSGQSHRNVAQSPFNNRELTQSGHSLAHLSSHHSQSPNVPVFRSAEYLQGLHHNGSVGVERHDDGKDHERVAGQTLSTNQDDQTETEV